MTFVHPGILGWILLAFSALLLLLQTAIGAYFAILFLLSPFRRPRPLPEEAPTTRFSLVVPARNEENVIRRVLDSIAALDYPKDLLRLFVIADNCTDATAAIARDCGAEVLERYDLERCTKSEALSWAFYDRGLLAGDSEAICIIDADNIVEPSFLRHVERWIRTGYAVVQGRCESHDPDSSFAGSFSDLFFTLGNRFWHLPLANQGVSILNYGTGVAIRVDHLRRIGWNTSSLVEDTEFGLQTILAGQSVHYCDEAEYMAEHANSFATLWKQQRRWLSGIVECGRLYFKDVLRRWVKGRDRNALTGVVKLLLPLLCVLTLVQLLFGPLATFAILGPQAVTPLTMLAGVAYFLASGFLSAVLILAFDGKLSMRKWRGILMFPIYPFFLGAVAFLSIVHPKRHWETIDHGTAQSVEPISPA